MTAPSVASYYRLRPNRWAPVQADVGPLDRGAALRICPVSGGDPAQRARQFNVEFRVADATASPYLALAMLVQAGLDGIRHAAADRAMQHPRPLPDEPGAGAAAARSQRAGGANGWVPDLLSAYLLFKRAEIKGLENLDETRDLSPLCRSLLSSRHVGTAPRS